MALSVDRATESLLRHVVARTLGRRVLYVDAPARAAAVRHIAELCARHRLRCLVYSVTDRCVHVVLDGAAGAGALASEEIVGQGLRFAHCQSTIVNVDLYLLEVARHALLAPVRAGLVRRAIEWPHSSVREACGLSAPPVWLDPAPLYDVLGPRDGLGAARFRRFMESD